MHISLNIIICTYSPEQPVFARCLNSVAKLDIPPGVEVKVIIVDNNSPVPINTVEYISNVVTNNNFEIIVEPKPGLTHARLAGLNHSTAEWLVFFDDDNEPASDYLTGVVSLINEHRSVGVWGPGVIKVDYLDKVSPWFTQNKNLFQEKALKEDTFANSKGWSSSYPPGTGQVINRKILEAYQQNVLTGKLSSKDRTGKSLASAGDVQIVFTALALGYSAGVSPKLKLTHIISGKKTNMRYVKRHAFGTSVSYLNAYLEFYPEDKDKYRVSTGKAALRNVYHYLKKRLTGGLQEEENLRLFAKSVGEKVGVYRALKIKEPLIYSAILKIFKLE